MRVAVRPAKPLMFATIRGVPVLGLPGNPASAFVSYHLFARAVLDRLAGDRLGRGAAHASKRPPPSTCPVGATAGCMSFR